MLGVIHKVLRSDIVILDSPPPPVLTHTLLAYTPTPSTSVRILFLKEDMTRAHFVNYYQLKNHKKRYKIQSYRKMWNKNTKKSPRIEVALFNFTGEARMDNFGCLNSSLYFLFCNDFAKKKLWRTYAYRCAFSRTTSPPSERTYFTDNPLMARG